MIKLAYDAKQLYQQYEEAVKRLENLKAEQQKLEEKAAGDKESFKRGRKGKKLSRGGKGNTAEELQYYRRKSKSHESGIERNKKGCTGSRAE